jgi:tetratricopeptide (TPR) repeat protein
MKFRLISVVWGERFTNLFLGITVRSLLGDGNITELANRYPATYTIYTTEESKVFFQQSQLFRQLSDTIRVEFVVFARGEIDPKNPSSHWIAWRRGAALAQSNQEIAFFIISDMLYASGTLVRWADLFKQGFKAVWTCATQVVLETAVAELEARFPASAGGAISMPKEAVIELAIRHLHPIIISMFRDSRRGSRHPEVVFCEVPGDGLAVRAIGSHPFCVDPNFFTMSDAFSPLDHFEAIAFDESRGVGLEPMLKAPDLYFRVAPVDADRLSNMGSWLDFFCTPADMLESMHSYRFTVKRPENDVSFRRADAALAFYACQVRITGMIYRTIREMRRAGCRLAAAFASTAHYTGRLRRHWKVRGPVVVFVPEDAAIEAFGLDYLLEPGNEEALIDAVMTHIVPGQLRFSTGEQIFVAQSRNLRTGTGGSAQLITSAKIVSGPIEIDNCTIYVVDRPLLSRRLVCTLGNSILPLQWTVHPGRLLVQLAEPAPESPPAPAEAAAEAPAQPAAAPSTGSILRALHFLVGGAGHAGHRRASIDWWIRRALRVLYRVAIAIPGAAKPVEWLKWAVIRNVRRVRAQIQRRLTIAQRELVAEVAAETSVHPEASSDAAPLFAQEVAADAATRTTDTDEQLPAARLTAELLDKFHDLQLARVLLVLIDVLRFYRSKSLEFIAEYPPLAAVEACILDTGIDEDKIAAGLREILRDAPEFAEAWYEMGDIHLKRGEYTDAVVCFDRCLLAKFELAVPPGRTGYDVLAAFAKASALEASGRWEAALETYRRATGLTNPPGMMRVTYARLLKKLGKAREAAFEFDAGMESDATAYILPAMPADFSLVKPRLAARFAQFRPPF